MLQCGRARNGKRMQRASCTRHRASPERVHESFPVVPRSKDTQLPTCPSGGDGSSSSPDLTYSVTQTPCPRSAQSLPGRQPYHREQGKVISSRSTRDCIDHNHQSQLLGLRPNARSAGGRECGTKYPGTKQHTWVHASQSSEDKTSFPHKRTKRRRDSSGNTKGKGEWGVRCVAMRGVSAMNRHWKDCLLFSAALPNRTNRYTHLLYKRLTPSLSLSRNSCNREM